MAPQEAKESTMPLRIRQDRADPTKQQREAKAHRPWQSPTALRPTTAVTMSVETPTARTAADTGNASANPTRCFVRKPAASHPALLPRRSNRHGNPSDVPRRTRQRLRPGLSEQEAALFVTTRG